MKILLTLATVLGSSLLLTAQPLFYEDWSQQQVGDTASSFTQWTLTAGTAAQFRIVENPPIQTGKFVVPDFSVTGAAALPYIRSSSSFAIGQGLELSTDIHRISSTSNYFRVTLLSSENANHNYWFEVHDGYVRLQKQIPGTVTTLGSNYNLLPGELDAMNKITLRLFKVSESENRLEVLVNDILRISAVDNSGLPNLGDEVYIRLGVREPVDGHVGKISLQSIPEPHHLSALFGALVLALIFFRSRTSR